LKVSSSPFGAKTFSMTPTFLRFATLASLVVTGACTATITDSGPNGSGGSSLGPGPGPGTAGSAGSLPTETLSKLDLTGTATYYRVIRLTNEQWTNSVQGVLGLTSPPTNAESFQSAVSGTTDFTNNEIVLDVSSNRAWADFADAAADVAQKVTSDPAALNKIYAGSDAAGFISTLGRRVYRRPLTATEATNYQQLFDLGVAMSGAESAFVKGARVVIEAMLQSPHFLYRTELGAAGEPLSGYELGAKLSLWLRDATPDDALLDAAAAGQLDSASGAATVARQLLETPAAKAVMRRFHGQYLHFDEFADLSKVGVASYDEAINPELAEASYLFFDRIFSQGLGVKDVFLSTTGFVGPQMAKLYPGAAAPASGLVERELGANRVGFFTQLPFLALYAHNNDPDPIHRGKSISLDVLCAPLGPPADVPPLPAPKPGQTNRQRVDEHTSGCGANCHNDMINPLGFAFENFDGMGQYRTTERVGTADLPIDASGAFDFVGGLKSYRDATELMNVLATTPQAHLCYAKKLASYGLQRTVLETDGALLSALAGISTSTEGSIKKVIEGLVAQDAFRIRARGAQ
jgi:hypothetical protein